MIRLSDLKIDPASLGTNLMLTDIRPVYDYKSGSRTDDVIGYKYEVACPEHHLEKITIKISGNQQIEMKEGSFPVVEFRGLEIKVYVINGDVRLTATADKILQKQGGQGQ
ncbi:MAG: hypothetical protein LKE86_08760 [Eubacterium sp.]|nr:hypothetical protein [Eubacterium sp.]MCH4047491.1 hypothetical protein [Eubacterium sp.]